MEDLRCPVDRTPLSTLLAVSNGKGEPIRLAPGWLQELPEGVAVQVPAALGTPLRIFCLGLLPYLDGRTQLS